MLLRHLVLLAIISTTHAFQVTLSSSVARRTQAVRAPSLLMQEEPPAPAGDAESPGEPSAAPPDMVANVFGASKMGLPEKWGPGKFTTREKDPNNPAPPKDPKVLAGFAGAMAIAIALAVAFPNV